MSVQLWYAIVRASQKRARVSMWPSVSSPSSQPRRSHSTRFAPRWRRSAASIAGASSPLRWSDSRQRSVVRIVPSPSGLDAAALEHQRHDLERRGGEGPERVQALRDHVVRGSPRTCRPSR